MGLSFDGMGSVEYWIPTSSVALVKRIFLIGFNIMKNVFY